MNTSIENESNITERGQILPCPFCGSHPRYGAFRLLSCSNKNCPVHELLFCLHEWNRRAKPGGEKPIPQQPLCASGEAKLPHHIKEWFIKHRNSLPVQAILDFSEVTGFDLNKTIY